jgi:outer membrane receptor protein involved in Fe transport
MRIRTLIAFAIVVVPRLFPFVSVSAAQGTAPAAIIGQVRDGTGAVLPGVTVTATSPALQVPEVTAVTDPQGEYRLSPLPIGTYAVTWELSGFQALKQEGVRLTVGFTARVDQTMQIGSVTETLSVTAETPLVDVTATATVTDLTTEEVRLIPTNESGLKAFFTQVPGVRSNIEVGNSGSGDSVQFRVYGQSAQAYSTLEGVFAGGAGTVQPGNHFEFNALEGVRVQAVGSNAEMPRRGLLIDATVKSGGNDLHGGSSILYTNHNFESNNIGEQYQEWGLRTKPKLHWVTDFNAHLGGRIIRDKLWFFASVRADGNDQDVLDAFYPDGTPIVLNSRQSYHVEKLSYQMTPNNKIIGFNHLMREFQRRDASFYVPAESRLETELDYNIRKIEWQSVRGNSLLTSLQHGYFDYIGARDGMSDNPATLDIATQMVTGNHLMDAQIPGVSRHHTRGVVQWYLSEGWGGNHEVRTGFDYMRYDSHNINGAQDTGDYQLRFNNGRPFQLVTYNHPTSPRNIDELASIYAQDNWTVARRLTLSLGLRYDRNAAYIPEQCREEGRWAAAACFDRVELPVWNAFAPRANFSFDVVGDGKTVVKGGYGRFNQMRDGEVGGLNQNGSRNITWTWRDLNGDRDYNPGEVNLDPQGPDFVAVSAGVSRIVNPDERQPKADQYSLTLERQIASRWMARATAVYARNTDNQRLLTPGRPYQSYNIPHTRPDPGNDGALGTADDPGRTITFYSFPSELQGAALSTSMVINDPNADQTYKTIEVAATRQYSDGWQLNASYSATKKNIPFGTGLTAYNPNAEIFIADNTWEWSAKVSGAYTFPREIVASLNFEHRSGDPYARQVLFTAPGSTIPSIVLNVEPIGSIRTPHVNMLDARITKRIGLGGSGQAINLRMDVFNVMNIDTLRNWNVRAGPDYLRPTSGGSNNATSIVPPRLLMFGVSYIF